MIRILTAIAALLMLASCEKKEETPPKPVVLVKLAAAKTEDLVLAVHAPASVFARETANLASRITAPIVSLGARKGDSVAKGQVLARLENRDLLAQKRELEAAIVDADANLSKIQSGTQPAEIERARSQVAVAQAALNQAQKFYERRKELFDKGAIPNRDLVISQTELAQAKANFDAARKGLETTEGASKEKDIQMAQSRLEQARARLAQVAAQIEFAEIRAPFAGVVTEQFVFPGDMAKPDSLMFTVMDLSVAVARAQVPESEASRIRRGQACEFTSQDLKGEFHGMVSVVNQAVDPQRRTVEVWCDISNGRGALRGGLFGKAEIATGKIAHALVVPQTAVQFKEGTKKGAVWVTTDGKTAVKREVEAGETADGKVQILAGLKEGDQVIAEGSYGLADKADIRVGEAKSGKDKDDKQDDDKKEESKKPEVRK